MIIKLQPMLQTILRVHFLTAVGWNGTLGSVIISIFICTEGDESDCKGAQINTVLQLAASLHLLTHRETSLLGGTWTRNNCN